MNRIGCILLAAGEGKRFGSDKLNETVNGVSLLEHAVCVHMAQDYSVRIAVTAQGRKDRIKGFDHVLINPNPERGISSSIHIGVEKLIQENSEKALKLSGVLFSVSDQPMLNEKTVKKLLKTAGENPDRIIVPVAENGKRGNPVVFPIFLIEEFLKLEGDVGGNQIIRRHEDMVVQVSVSSRELIDVDTQEDIQTIRTGKENEKIPIAF